MKLPLLLFATFSGLVVLIFGFAFRPPSSHVGFVLLGSAGIALLVVLALFWRTRHPPKDHPRAKAFHLAFSDGIPVYATHRDERLASWARNLARFQRHEQPFRHLRAGAFVLVLEVVTSNQEDR